MNGYQLVDAGLALRPNLKVLLMTGYAQDPIPKRISEAGIQVLYKPFDFDKLPGFANEILERE
jgi:DNA-binding NtrC family response regulator